MPSIVSQYDFTHGEASPLYQGRPDLEFYSKSASLIKNMICKSNGSVKSRFGTYNRYSLSGLPLFIDTWSFGNGDDRFDYLIVVNDDDIQCINLRTFATGDTYFIAKTFSVLDKFRGAQQQNNYVLTSGNDTPFILTGNLATGEITGADITYNNPPTAEFDNKYAYTTTFTLQTVERTSPGTATASLPILEITNMGTFGGFTADFVGGEFLSQGDINTEEDGVGIIEEYISSTQVRLRVMTAFRKIPGWTSGVEGSFNGSECNLTQQAYTSTTGYPTAACFFQDRLILAGGKQTPQTIFGSQTGDYDNFALGTGLDDEGIQTTISGSGDIIQNLVSSKSLQIFTKYGEYSTSLWQSEALTPSNARSISLQSSYGSENVQPVIIDNQTIYVKGGGKALMSFYYPEGSTSYTSKNISFYSEHLIDSPSSMAVLSNSEYYDSNTLFIINNGITPITQMTTLEIMSDQNVSAYSRFTKSSDAYQYYLIAALRNRVFLVTQRGGYYLEEISDYPLDFMKSGDITFDSSNKSVTLGPDYAGLKVSVIDDYSAGPNPDENAPQVSYIGEYTADENGIIYPEYVSDNADQWKYGIPFEQEVTTMPIHMMTQNGDNRYLKKKLSKIYVEYHNSFSFQIGTKYPSTKSQYPLANDYWTYDLRQVPIQRLSTSYSEGIGNPYNPMLSSLSGVYETPINSGYRANTYVTIKQTLPLPLEILGVAIQTNV